MIKREEIFNIADMTKIALCTALLCAASFLVIPLPFTPIVLSAHTIVVNLVGLVLKPRHAIYTILIYLFMGAVGLPVFSGGTAGISRLFGPAGGFYIGFLFAAYVISRFKGERVSFFRYTVVTVLAGITIIHSAGVLFMCVHNGFNAGLAFMQVSAPFVIGDIIKCAVASFIATAVNKTIKID